MYSRAEREYPGKDKLGRGFGPHWRRCVCSPLPSREFAGLPRPQSLVRPGTILWGRWAQASRWAHRSEETMGIEPLLHRIKIGFLTHQTALSTWDISLFVPVRLRRFVTWVGYSPVLSGGCQLCCCSLNQELEKTCGGQMLEKAAPCRHLARGNTMWAKEWRKTEALQACLISHPFLLQCVSSALYWQSCQCASWQRKHVKGPYPFSQIRQWRENL